MGAVQKLQRVLLYTIDYAPFICVSEFLQRSVRYISTDILHEHDNVSVSKRLRDVC